MSTLSVFPVLFLPHFETSCKRRRKKVMATRDNQQEKEIIQMSSRPVNSSKYCLERRGIFFKPGPQP